VARNHACHHEITAGINRRRCHSSEANRTRFITEAMLDRSLEQHPARASASSLTCSANSDVPLTAMQSLKSDDNL